MLQLRPTCECCDRLLPASSRDARICSFECTFCADCADTRLRGICPNCGGELVRRPIRPEAELAKFPASTERVFKPKGCKATSPGLGPTPDSIVVETFDSAPTSLLQAIDQGLEDHNLSVAPLQDVSPLSVIARDAHGQVLGGAVGRTWGGCCELLQLWVSKDQRSRGLGTRLLQQFENAARTRRCTVFYLTTLSYQAPDFYKRRGYSTAAEIAGYPDDIRKLLMLRIEA